MRPEDDPRVVVALRDGRRAEDITLIDCPYCGAVNYYNEGSHASCIACDREIPLDVYDGYDPETYTLAEYWAFAPYPCDEK